MSQANRQRLRLFDNPRAYCATSSWMPLVWLSYVLPGARKGASDPRPIPKASDVNGGLLGSPEQVVTTSRKLSIQPSIAAFAGRWIPWKWPWEIGQGKTIVGWGYRTSGRRAVRVAGKKDGRFVLLEDGFLRSVDRHDPPFGINLDDRGLYYDPASSSRLFDLIRRPLGPEQTRRARSVADQWRKLGLSKYNGQRSRPIDIDEGFVLVIDQVRNDLSIRSGCASARSFDRMLDAALASSDGPVVVKIHPDSAADPAKSHYDASRLAREPRIRVVSDTSHVSDYIEKAQSVFVVTSQVGFEALIHGKPVHVFGMPFYAGWGLTIDALDRPSDRQDVPLEQIVHAALVEYPRYFNPVAQREVEVEDAMTLIGFNRRLRSQWPETIYALGFSAWKRPFIRKFLSGSKVRFVSSAQSLPRDATLLVWGRKSVPDHREDLRVLRIEDGFLRSSGLGADLVQPLSLVIDDQGIYYDASGPSRLETILEQSELDETQRIRAAALRKMIVARRLSKYNLGGDGWQRPADAGRVLLVVGQVEDDASIRFGSPETRTNIDLLRKVRAANPEALIVYKPHPDVVAGLRSREQERDAIANLCDAMVTDTDPIAMLEQVDEVHTMTSLMGFEALLRGVPVTCYGLPFYSGWGLTEDRLECARRTRRLTLDEVVHGALIDYPRYWSQRGQLFASPEDILVELGDLARAGPSARSFHRKVLRAILGTWQKLVG